MDKKAKPVPAATVDDLPLINAIIAKGDRAELIPVKDGVKVMRVRREEMKKDGFKI